MGATIDLLNVRTTESKNQKSCRFWVAISLTLVAWGLPILWLHSLNNRLLPSWHGFLHSAIATRFPSALIPPENPFFAGEPLPYYWFHHFLGYAVARIFQTDLLHAFQLISLASLIVLVVFGGLIGRRQFRSIGAGLLIGYLALVGVNPLGPAIAGAKHVLKGTRLVSEVSRETPVENVFVSWEEADQWMTQPLLPAMYITSNWKHGQNLVWFFDISSRTPALALIMVLLFLVLSSRLMWGGKIMVVLVGALITALSPLIGFAVSGSLVAGMLLFSWLPRYGGGEEGGAIKRSLHFSTYGFLALVGCGLALPTYYHLFFIHGGTLSLTPVNYALLKGLAIMANFLVLVPLALAGTWGSNSEENGRLWAITVAGLLLLCSVPILSVKPGNEHNLTNVAQCLLAIPAVAWMASWVGEPKGSGNIKGILEATRRLPPGMARSRWSLISEGAFFLKHLQCGRLGKVPRPFGKQGGVVLIVILFIPTTLGTFLSYVERPSLPLGFKDARLLRLPATGPLQLLYEWIRNSTPANAVFIVDPEDPVKMSGNVSELPAFTSRTLFVDNPTYLTQPYEDRMLRERIAHLATTGHLLSPEDIQYVSRLRRQVYVMTFHANQNVLFKKLIAQHGAPVFEKDFVAVFPFGLL